MKPSRPLSFDLTGAFALAVLLFLPALVFADDDAPIPMTELLPGETLLLVHSRDGHELLDGLMRSGVKERITSSDAWKAFYESEDGKELQQGLSFFQVQVGLPPLEIARALLDGEVALSLALVSDKKQPEVLLISRPRQPEVLRKLLNALTVISGQAIEKVVHKGVDATAVNGTVFFWVGDTFVLGRDPGLLEATIDRLRGDATGSLAKAPSHKEIERLSDLGPITGFIDLDRLRKMQGGKLEGLDGPLPQPLASLVFGGYRQLLRESKSVAAGLSWQGDGLQLRGIASPVSAKAGHPCYFPDQPSRGIPAPPGTIASMLVQRNLASWWDARLSLVSESAHSAMSKFANDIGNILGGREFGEEILSLAGNGIELFAISPKDRREDEKVPAPLLPGFALAIPLSKDAERPSPTLQAMFQTLISFINIDGASKDRGPLLFGSREHRGVTITSAAPIFPDDGRDLGIEFNFKPSIAVSDGVLFLASNDHAIEKLIDAQDVAGSAANSNAAVRLDGAALQGILQANRLALIANSVLEGKSLQEATTEMNTLFEIIGLVKSFTLRLEPKPDSKSLELTIDLKLDVEKTKQEEF